MKGLLRWLLQVLVSVLLLAWLLAQLDRAQIARLLAQAPVIRIVLAFSLHFLGVGISLIRWRLLLTPLGIRLPWLALGWVYWMGAFFNTFLPTNIGGDVIRIYKTAQWSGHTARATASVVVERWTGLIAFLVICLMALGLGAWQSIGALWALALVGLTAVLCLLLVYLIRSERLHVASRRFGPLARKWAAFREALRQYHSHGAALTAAMAWAFVVQGIVIVYFYVVAWALGLQGPPLGYAVVVPLSQLVALIPISLWGFGTREAVFIGMAPLLGLRPEQAFLVSMTGAVLGIGFNMMGVLTLWIPYRPQRSPAAPTPPTET